MKKLISILTASVIFLYSCKKDSGDDPVTPNPPPVDPVIPPSPTDNILNTSAHIVDTTAISNVTATSVSISKTLSSYKPAVGDILLAAPSLNSPNGLLSKITAISETSTQIICTIVPSNLNDAFKQLNINYSYVDTYSGFAGYRASSSFDFTFSNTFYKAINIAGVVKLNIPVTHWEYKKTAGSLKPEKIVIRADFNTDGSSLEISNTEDGAEVFEGFKKTFRLPNFYVSVPIGPILLPIPFTQEVEVTTFSLEFTGKSSLNILPKMSATVGCKYENGAWTNLSTYSIDASAVDLVRGKFSPSGSFAATATIINPRYIVKPGGLDIMSGFFEVPLSLELEGQHSTPNYSLKLSLGIKGGIETEFWLGQKQEYSISGDTTKTLLEGNWPKLVLTTTGATSVTQVSAESGGNITDDGRSNIISRGVCWNTSINPTVYNDKTSDGTGKGVFTSSLTGLTPNTTYYVRAYAINNTDTAYGNEINFTTSPPVPPTLTTNNASAITANTATSGGNITNDGGADITSRGVCWGTNANPTIANSKTSDGTGTGNFTSSLTGLLSQTIYHARAYATNSAGTAYGNDISFSTPPGVIATVNTASITDVTISSAISGGNVTNDGGNPVTSRGVCWSTAANPTIANSKTNNGSGTGSFTSSITGLTDNTTYHIRAYATNNAGTSYGAEFIFTTISAALPAVSTIGISAIATTTATSGGNVTSDGGIPVTARGVCWATHPDPTIYNSKTTDGSGTGSFTSSLTGLLENTTYHVRAYATNNTGTAYGNDISFTTTSSVPQVTILNQTWTSKNLDVTTYRNGDPIPQVTDPEQWRTLTTGAWCYYNNDPANGAIYGKMYNWYALVDPRGLAPAGWRIPDYSDWYFGLTNNLGGYLVAGGHMKSTGTSLWQSPNTGATNSSGFTGLPGGQAYFSYLNQTPNMLFIGKGTGGAWWSNTTENINGGAFVFHLVHDDTRFDNGGLPKNSAAYVRCIKE